MGGAKWPGEVHVVCRTRAVVSDPESCLNDQKDRYGVEAFFSMVLHGTGQRALSLVVVVFYHSSARKRQKYAHWSSEQLV